MKILILDNENETSAEEMTSSDLVFLRNGKHYTILKSKKGKAGATLNKLGMLNAIGLYPES